MAVSVKCGQINWLSQENSHIAPGRNFSKETTCQNRNICLFIELVIFIQVRRYLWMLWRISLVSTSFKWVLACYFFHFIMCNVNFATILLLIALDQSEPMLWFCMVRILTRASGTLQLIWANNLLYFDFKRTSDMHVQSQFVHFTASLGMDNSETERKKQHKCSL